MMHIANGVEMLEITATVMGQARTIYPTLIWDADTVVLVDAGFPGQADLIRDAIERQGVSFDRLTRLVLTHHDIDHIGSAGAIQQALPGQVEVLASATEKPYIEGELRPLKLAQMEAGLTALPPEMKAMYERLNAGFAASFVHVDQTVSDGEVLPYQDGVTVIATPGHTLGHICLYLPETKTLIAGDALSIIEGRVMMAPPSNNYDNDLCMQSLVKLSGYDIETVICYHGGAQRGNITGRIKELVGG